jgi:hypothetical protein
MAIVVGIADELTRDGGFTRSREQRGSQQCAGEQHPPGLGACWVLPERLVGDQLAERRGLPRKAARLCPAGPAPGPGAHVAAQRMEQGRGHQRHRSDRDRRRKTENLGHQLEQRRADSAGQDHGGRIGRGPRNHVLCPCARTGHDSRGHLDRSSHRCAPPVRLGCHRQAGNVLMSGLSRRSSRCRHCRVVVTRL